MTRQILRLLENPTTVKWEAVFMMVQIAHPLQHNPLCRAVVTSGVMSSHFNRDTTPDSAHLRLWG